MSMNTVILPIHNQTSLGESSIPIQIQFEGETYEATCAVLPIKYQEKVRGVLYFNHIMVGPVGIFASSDLFLLAEKARTDLLQYLEENREAT
jgi:hypothetical protein